MDQRAAPEAPEVQAERAGTVAHQVPEERAELRAPLLQPVPEATSTPADSTDITLPPE